MTAIRRERPASRVPWIRCTCRSLRLPLPRHGQLHQLPAVGRASYDPAETPFEEYQVRRRSVSNAEDRERIVLLDG